MGSIDILFLLSNDFSRKTWVYFLKVNAQVFETLKKFKVVAGKQSGYSKNYEIQWRRRTTLEEFKNIV